MRVGWELSHQSTAENFVSFFWELLEFGGPHQCSIYEGLEPSHQSFPPMFKSKAENFVMFFESYESLELSHQPKAENFVRFFFLRAMRVWRSTPMFHLWGFGAFPPILPTNVQIKSWKLCDVFWQLWEFGAFPPIKNWKLCEFFCLRAMRVWRSPPMFHSWGFGAFPPILPTNVQIKSGKLLRVMRVWGLIWELP